MIGTWYIEALAETGFMPADECDGAPEWARTGRYDALVVLSPERMLTANYREDTLTLTVTTLPNGLIEEVLGFNAPEGDLSDLTVLAFESVVEAWVGAS